MTAGPYLKSISPVILLLLFSNNIEAQESVHFGVQASLLSFQGDVKSHLSNSPGNDLGIHLGIPVGGNQEIRPSVSWRTPPRESSPESDGHMYGATAGVDYLFYFDSHQNGLYVMAGASAFRWFKNGSSIIASQTSSGAVSYVDTHGVEPSLGIGYRVNRFLGFESRIAFSHMNRTDGQQDRAPFISLGIVFH